MKKLSGIIFILLAISIVCVFCFANKREKGTTDGPEEAMITACNFSDRLKQKADSAKAYCKQRNFNTDYCFLVDFSLHSGKQRFFVWDFTGDSIKYSSLCAHGYGQGSTESTPVFSNVEGSYCSSLGRYKVGIRSYSKWGINVHYKLHGLEKTNNNAYKRIVVLHSFDPIPDYDIHPMHLPLGMSQGCPVISNEIMRQVDALQKKAIKPTLLWAYD